jgi:nucleotide-binding universal stress UspA family protein
MLTLDLILQRRLSMNADSQGQKPSHIRLVVGVDLSDVSEHLLEQTRSLIRPVDEAEVHLVHVVHPDPLREQIERPIHSPDIGARSHIEYAKWELQRLCGALALGPRTRVHVNTPVGDAAEELTRIATEVGADMVVVEAHEHDASEPRRAFHRSVVARIASTAPCTVLTIRRPQPDAAEPAANPDPLPTDLEPVVHLHESSIVGRGNHP